MQRNNFSHPDTVVDWFLDKNSKLLKRKAGTWQGVDSYKDLDMFVLRNVELNLDFSDEADTETRYKIINPDLPWAEDHFLERISSIPSNPGDTYKYWPYHNNLDSSEFKGEKFDHTYQERFWPKEVNNLNPIDDSEGPNWGMRFPYGDYNDLVKQLADNPLTRQAYLPIFFPEDTGSFKQGKNIRVPCTLGYLFEIWDNRLDITYYIRSCDIFRHYRNDIYLAYRLIEHTSLLLYNLYGISVKVGCLNMKIANLHLFENDYYPFMKKERNIKNL